LVGRMDGENYGKLSVYRFPKQSLVYGPKQIANRINQDTDISRQLTLWDQKGSQVIRGELLVIPIEESLIYVQPLYVQAQNNPVPRLEDVILVYGGQAVHGGTLNAALCQLPFGASYCAAPGGQVAPPSGQPISPATGATTTPPAMSAMHMWRTSVGAPTGSECSCPKQ